MPIEFRCANCRKLLRVGDEAVGKKARCPDCGTIQEAVESSPIPPTTATPKPAANPFADQAPAGSPFAQAVTNPYQTPQGTGFSVPLSREAAREKVQGPATALLVIAVICCLLQVGTLATQLLLVAWGRPRWEDIVPGAVGMIFGLGITATIAFGALKMRRLEAYPLAMAAAIMAMLPCSGCCILSMPIGVWALVVLLDAQVKSAFE